MKVIINFCLVIVIGIFSLAKALDQYCFGGLCFFRPDQNSANMWSAAQQQCKDNNATLPIVDNPDHQKSFLDALSHFHLNGMDVWLGANASDDGPDNWRWLDGRQYNGPDVQERGSYYKSYAYVAKRTVEVLAYATAPNNSYSYICQYNLITPDDCRNDTEGTSVVVENRCYMKYDAKLPWFNARNKCLKNNGNLASLSQLSLLDGIVDSSGFWVGLRHSHWDWRNATGASSDVTFTSWKIGQPNDAAPHCLAIDQGDYPNWKDFDCTHSYSYICQGTSTSQSIPNTPFSFSSTTSSTSSTTITTTRTTPPSYSHSPEGTSESNRKSVGSSTPTIENSQTSRTNLVTVNEGNATSNDDGNVNKALAIGLGVGLGVPFLIIIVVIIIVLFLRRRRRNRENTGRKHSDNTPAHYATVREANPGSKFDPPSSQDVVDYAGLRFAS